MRRKIFLMKHKYNAVKQLIDDEIKALKWLPDDYLFYVLNVITNNVIKKLDFDIQEDKVREMVLDSIINKVNGGND